MLGGLSSAIRLGLNSGQAQAALQQLEARFTAATRTMSSAIGPVVGGIGALGAAVAGVTVAAKAWADSTAEAISEQRILAERLGVSIERFSAYTRIAADFGAEAEDVSDVMKDLSVRALEMEADFSMFGISVRDARGNLLDAEPLFLRVMGALQRMGATQRAVAADVLASDALVRLAEMARRAGGDLGAMADEMVASGKVISAEAARINDEYIRAQHELDAALRVTSTTIGTTLAEAFTPVLRQTAAWLDANQALVRDGITKLNEALNETVQSIPAILDGLSKLAYAAAALTTIASIGTKNVQAFLAAVGLFLSGSVFSDLSDEAAEAAASLAKMQEEAKALVPALDEVADATAGANAEFSSIPDGTNPLMERLRRGILSGRAAVLEEYRKTIAEIAAQRVTDIGGKDSLTFAQRVEAMSLAWEKRSKALREIAAREAADRAREHQQAMAERDRRLDEQLAAIAEERDAIEAAYAEAKDAEDYLAEVGSRGDPRAQLELRRRQELEAARQRLADTEDFERARLAIEADYAQQRADLAAQLDAEARDQRVAQWREEWGTLATLAEDALSGMGGLVSQVVADAFSGQDVDAGRFFGGIISSMGTMLIQLGTAGLLAATLGSLVPALAPVTGGPAGLGASLAAIAGGVAMVGVGTAMGGASASSSAASSASSRASSATGSRGGSGFFADRGSAPSFSAADEAGSAQPAIVNVVFNRPVDSRRARRELQDVLTGGAW
jgi:hypothetical protein